ncbi:cation diffusion facilitator family transporter [Paracoccus pacificus]|uniref:Cation diffusion facilitator family transporter n=1 Tax=Paracoccus pacificus TaxID=1463598 RepID=A0ABW4R9Y8_9RHOB
MNAAHSSPKPDIRLAVSAGIGSLSVAVLLTGMKVWALWQTGSLAVATSLADSALDLLMSAAALAAIIYAAKPEDDEHSFGHHAVEDLAVLAQSLLVLGSAGVIAWLSIGRLMSSTPPTLANETAGSAAMLLSMLITFCLVAWQSHVVRKTGNQVVAADRLHYLSDLLPSMGAILALQLSQRLGWTHADAVIGLIAAAYMIRSAAQQGGSAWNALMDHQADPEVIATVTRLADSWPGVLGWHDLQTRRSGSRNFIHLHVELDGTQPLKTAHDIGAGLRAAILRELPDSYVIIHKDVWQDHDHTSGEARNSVDR